MNKSLILKTAGVLATLLVLLPGVWGRSNEQALFKYVAGTKSMSKGCEGKLEITESNLVFECNQQSLTIPYHAIKQMEFEPEISKTIRKMKLAWAVKPKSEYSKHCGFFSVIYSEKGQTHAIILQTRNDTMRPYLAEIDLKTGHPIESRK